MPSGFRTARLAALSLATACAICAPAVNASMLVPLDAAQLTDRSELIFVGKAVHQESIATADASYAYTFVTFDVSRILKGATESDELVLRLDGGSIDEDNRLVVMGMPRFLVGQTYLLFVAGNERAVSPIVGWTQGQFGLRTEARTGRETWIDRTGSTLLGMDGSRWLRSEPAADPESLVEVVAEEGVEIIGGPVRGLARAKPRKASPPSAALLDQLQSFVTGRRALKSYRKGGLVLSASPLNVPATRVFETTTSRGESR